MTTTPHPSNVSGRPINPDTELPMPSPTPAERALVDELLARLDPTPRLASPTSCARCSPRRSPAHTPDPAADAQTFLGRLARDGWRYVPAVADHPAPARTAPRPVAERYVAEIRSELADVKRRREEREAAEARAARGGAA